MATSVKSAAFRRLGLYCLFFLALIFANACREAQVAPSGSQNHLVEDDRPPETPKGNGP